MKQLEQQQTGVLIEISKNDADCKDNHKESNGSDCCCVHVYEKTVQEAVLLFRKVRNRNQFVDDKMTDVVDMGIQQMDMSNRVGYIENRVDAIEENVLELKKDLNDFKQDLESKFIILLDEIKKKKD